MGCNFNDRLVHCSLAETFTKLLLSSRKKPAAASTAAVLLTSQRTTRTAWIWCSCCHAHWRPSRLGQDITTLASAGWWTEALVPSNGYNTTAKRSGHWSSLRTPGLIENMQKYSMKCIGFMHAKWMGWCHGSLSHILISSAYEMIGEIP